MMSWKGRPNHGIYGGCYVVAISRITLTSVARVLCDVRQAGAGKWRLLLVQSEHVWFNRDLPYLRVVCDARRQETVSRAF